MVIAYHTSRWYGRQLAISFGFQSISFQIWPPAILDQYEVGIEAVNQIPEENEKKKIERSL